jgi:metallo-beta-lactamase class B
MKSALTAILLALFACAFGQSKLPPIMVTHLTGNVYVHTSYGLLDDGSTYPANGLYIVTDAGIIMIDTPWGETPTLQLLVTLKARYNKPVLYCISTHFHADRTGGVDVLKKRGIKTYSSKLTLQLAKQKGQHQPEFTFANDTTFTSGNFTVQTFYPGAGHTQDNIVVWLPSVKVLFGGCFVKSMESTDIGNLSDADLAAWPQSLANVEHKFKNIKYVIPGHLSWKGDTLMLRHTLEMARKAKG